MARVPSKPDKQAARLVDLAVDRLNVLWSGGGRVRVEEVLRELQIDPNEPANTPVVSAALSHEFALRRASGEAISLETELSRFPALSDGLRTDLLVQSDSASLASGATEGPVTASPAAARSGDIQPAPNPPELEATPGSLGETQQFRPEAARRLGRYGLTELLGRGGFGEVWLGWDSELQRSVAIKLLRRDLVVSPEVHDRFLEEGRKLARLRHPHIVSIFDIGWEQNQMYLVSEFMEGGTLATRLKTSHIERERALQISIAVAEALHHAHLHGLVHRDVKPANILLGARGEVKLGDFGVAVSEVEQLKEDPGAVGTFAYMSPEQIRGESHHSDARSDIYSLGVVLYEMLTGRRPFVAESMSQLKDQVLTREPRPPRTIREDIPADLERTVLRCLSKDIRDRHTTAADLGAELKRHLGSRPRFQWMTAALVGGAFCAILLSLGAWHSYSNGQRKPAAAPGESPPVQPVNTLPDEWLARTGAKPEEIAWPGRKGRHRMYFNEESGALELTSEDPSLVRFGTIPRTGDWHVRIRCTRQTDFGAGGLFWDYREIDDGKEVAAQCEVFRLRRHFLGADRYVWRAMRSQIRIAPDSGHMQDLHLAESVIELPKGHAMTVDLKFQDGVLGSIDLEGVDLPALSQTFPAPASSTPGAPGPIKWGGFSESGAFYFSMPEILSD